MSINDCFLKLKEWLQPSDSNLSAAQRHVDEISSRLEKGFQFYEPKLLGSHSRGTAVQGHSDVDLFAVLKRDGVRWGGDVKNSDTVLSKVRSELKIRYPNNTSIGRDGQAIVVQFGDISVDVVPAFFNGFSSRPIYSIPDGNGDWMQTSPEAHNKYISDTHEKTGHKFKYATQFIKFWKSILGIPLSSFHLELLFASEGVFEGGVMTYSQCVARAFRLLYDRQCRALQDPLGISGWVKGVQSDSKLARTLSAVSSACERAEKALDFEERRNQPKAHYYWNLVFKDNFPAA